MAWCFRAPSRTRSSSPHCPKSWAPPIVREIARTISEVECASQQASKLTLAADKVTTQPNAPQPPDSTVAFNLLAKGFIRRLWHPPYHDGANDRRGHHVKDWRYRYSSHRDQPGCNERSEAPKDCHRDCVAGRHQGRAIVCRKDLGDRRRPYATEQGKYDAEDDLCRHDLGEGRAR